jgi:thiosulfate/3-mercaptopyruvate sulfurtransferase
MGITPGTHVVIYDGLGLFSAPRVWWTFKRFGHEAVSVLSGGAPRWRKEGHDWTNAPSSPSPQTYPVPSLQSGVADLEMVKQWSKTGQVQLVDARAADRFQGLAPEPRPGLKSGHIPNSINLPFGQLLVDGQLKSEAEIVAVFQAAGVDLSKPIATTCGSGVSAAILSIALEASGHPVTALYDGSWSEWGGRDDVEVATGP